MEIMILLHLLMAPANMVCDRVGLKNEHERGMMRMFVNMLICTALAGLAMWASWTIWT